jgi:hypothetical protein
MSGRATPTWLHEDESIAAENVIQEFRWPVFAERVIAAPAQAVWSEISRPGNLEDCHPFCASNPVHSWPGVGSRDEVHYLSGWVYERSFREWIDGVGYDLEIGRPGGGQSFVSWRIAPTGDQQSSLRITVCSHALQNLPVVVRWAPHMFWMRPLLRQYLESVVRGFEWYLCRGEPVPRDAFGTHPWFSTRG